MEKYLENCYRTPQLEPCGGLLDQVKALDATLLLKETANFVKLDLQGDATSHAHRHHQYYHHHHHPQSNHVNNAEVDDDPPTQPQPQSQSTVTSYEHLFEEASQYPQMRRQLMASLKNNPSTLERIREDKPIIRRVLHEASISKLLTTKSMKPIRELTLSLLKK